MYLERATDIADRTTLVFSTPTGLPHSMVNLAHRKGIRGLVSTAEMSTLQLDFKLLLFAKVVGDQVMEVLKKARIAIGLASIFLK